MHFMCRGNNWYGHLVYRWAWSWNNRWVCSDFAPASAAMLAKTRYPINRVFRSSWLAAVTSLAWLQSKSWSHQWKFKAAISVSQARRPLYFTEFGILWWYRKNCYNYWREERWWQGQLIGKRQDYNCFPNIRQTVKSKSKSIAPSLGGRLMSQITLNFHVLRGWVEYLLYFHVYGQCSVVIVYSFHVITGVLGLGTRCWNRSKNAVIFFYGWERWEHGNN